MNNRSVPADIAMPHVVYEDVAPEEWGAFGKKTGGFVLATP